MKESPPFWSFSPKKHYLRLDDFPGPGSYSPADIGKSTAPHYRLGTAKRSSLYSKQETPGPGSYSPGLSSTSPYWTLSGKTGRDGMCSGGEAYRLCKTNEFISVNSQMNSRKRTASVTEQYRDSSLNSSPKRGSNLPSKSIPNVSKSLVPGPGVYNTKPLAVGPCFTFSHRLDFKVSCPVPGPGEYKPNQSFVQAKGPTWVAGTGLKKLELGCKDQFENPGPGSYEKNTTLGGPQWSFGADKRKSNRFSNVPGPGSYKTQTVFGNPPSYMSLSK